MCVCDQCAYLSSPPPSPPPLPLSLREHSFLFVLLSIRCNPFLSLPHPAFRVLLSLSRVSRPGFRVPFSFRCLHSGLRGHSRPRIHVPGFRVPGQGSGSGFQALGAGEQIQCDRSAADGKCQLPMWSVGAPCPDCSSVCAAVARVWGQGIGVWAGC